ncbi:hypothetical protein DVH24_037875, partial [Malus domestica]
SSLSSLPLPSPSLSFPYPSSSSCISSNSAAFHLSTQTVKLYLHNPLPIIFSILKYESGIRDDEERSSSGVDG